MHTFVRFRLKVVFARSEDTRFAVFAVWRKRLYRVLNGHTTCWTMASTSSVAVSILVYGTNTPQGREIEALMKTHDRKGFQLYDTFRCSPFLSWSKKWKVEHGEDVENKKSQHNLYNTIGFFDAVMELVKKIDKQWYKEVREESAQSQAMTAIQPVNCLSLIHI